MNNKQIEIEDYFSNHIRSIRIIKAFNEIVAFSSHSNDFLKYDENKKVIKKIKMKVINNNIIDTTSNHSYGQLLYCKTLNKLLSIDNEIFKYCQVNESNIYMNGNERI